MRRFIDALASPRGLWLILGIALLLSAPAMRAGLSNDDFLHRVALSGMFPDYERDAFELYDFVDAERDPASMLRERGYAPWWAADGLHVRFFRPLSSLSLAADAEAFGLSPLPAHLHSLLYYFICVVLVWIILRLLLPARMAGIATLLYAIAGSHSTALAWVAARHVLIGAMFCLAAIAAHLHHRERGWRPGRWLALAALIVGGFASESILAAVAIIGCYELLGARDHWRQRAQALAPIAALALGYLAFYSAADYGARGSAMYVHPFADPGGFVIACLTRIPVLLGDAVTAVPTELNSMLGASIVPQAIFGALVTLAVIGLLALTRAHLSDDVKHHLRWLGIGAILALTPMAGGFVGGRMLATSQIGGAAVLAAALIALHRYATDRSGPRARFAQLAMVGWPLVFIGLSLLVRVGLAAGFTQLSDEQWRIARDSHFDCPIDGDVVILATADPSLTVYAPTAKVLLTGRMPFRSGWVLSMAKNDHRLERITERGFDIVVVGERTPNVWEGLHRDQPLRVGQVVTLRDMRIEIVAMRAEVPSHLRVSFERPLDAPDLCFVEWRDGLLRSVELPEPGGSLDLPREPSPMLP